MENQKTTTLPEEAKFLNYSQSSLTIEQKKTVFQNILDNNPFNYEYEDENLVSYIYDKNKILSLSKNLNVYYDIVSFIMDNIEQKIFPKHFIFEECVRSQNYHLIYRLLSDELQTDNFYKFFNILRANNLMNSLVEILLYTSIIPGDILLELTPLSPDDDHYDEYIKVAHIILNCRLETKSFENISEIENELILVSKTIPVFEDRKIISQNILSKLLNLSSLE